MSIRTTRKIVKFSNPFSIEGVGRVLPAGNYEVVTDEELIEGVSFPVYRRVAAMMLAPTQSSQTPSIEMLIRPARSRGSTRKRHTQRVFNKAVIHGPFTPVLAQNSPTRLHEDPLLLTRVPDGTRQHHPFYQPLCRFFTIAKFAVTPEDTENMGISPSGFSRERGALEFLSGMREIWCSFSQAGVLRH
jgi:hypothetical protein